MRIHRGKPFLMAALALILGAGLYRLFMPDPYASIENRLPLSIPYDFAKATQRVQVDFQVLPGDDVPAAYYVGFDIDRKGAFDPVRYLGDRREIPLNVIVERVSPAETKRIESFGMYQFGCINGLTPCSDEQRKEVSSGITRMETIGHTCNTDMIIAANFWVKGFGRYRVTLNFPNEVAGLPDIESKLVVRRKQRAK